MATLRSAGASGPGGSQVGTSRQQEVPVARGDAPNPFRQPTVRGDHRALSMSRRSAKIHGLQYLALRRQASSNVVIVRVSKLKPQARGSSAPGSSAWLPIALKHFMSNTVGAVLCQHSKVRHHASSTKAPTPSVDCAICW